jgi:hypothetical protein
MVSNELGALTMYHVNSKSAFSSNAWATRGVQDGQMEIHGHRGIEIDRLAHTL